MRVKRCGCDYGACFCYSPPRKSPTEEALEVVNTLKDKIMKVEVGKDREIESLKSEMRTLKEEKRTKYKSIQKEVERDYKRKLKEVKKVETKKIKANQVSKAFLDMCSRSKVTKSTVKAAMARLVAVIHEINSSELGPQVVNNIFNSLEEN